MSKPIVRVENLRKNYGAVEALRGVSFEIREGEVFGLLGPNGAGKTSTIEILEGLRAADGGSVEVCGMDPRTSGESFKHRIGGVLQSTALPDKMKVAEALNLFASFYPQRKNIEHLLARFELKEKRDAFYGQLSGGQKQRLALAMALVHDPQVIFLDEPTAGLDPQVRREIYTLVEQLKSEKKTLLLTTHYIEEAERLCDRVAIIDHGLVIALGTPRELKARAGGEGSTRIEVRLAQPELPGTLKELDGVADCIKVNGAYVLHTNRAPQTIVALVKYLDLHGNELQSLEMASQTLEDVFIELTGRKLRD